MAGNGLFETFNQDVMAALNLVSSAGSSVYVQFVTTLLTGAITLYVLWIGYQTLAGKLHTPVPDLLWDLVKFGIVLGFINNTGMLMALSVSALNEIKESLPKQSLDSVWGELDNLLVKTQSLGETLYVRDSNDVPLTGLTARGLVWVGSVILMLTVALVIIMANVTLYLLLITAPIFLFCLMFGFLRGLFNNWLQLIISSVLTLMFISLVSNHSLVFMNKVVAQVARQAPNANLMTMGGIVLMAGVLTGSLVILARYCALYTARVGVTGAVRGWSFSGLFVSPGHSFPGISSEVRHDRAHERRDSITNITMASVNTAVEVSGDTSITSAYRASVRMSQQAVANMKARSLK